MRCWHCNMRLIWGGDHALEEGENEHYDMVTSLTCPSCEAFVEVYRAKARAKGGKTEYSDDMPTCDEGTEE